MTRKMFVMCTQSYVLHSTTFWLTFRAEILQIFEDFKNSFWLYLTFNTLLDFKCRDVTSWVRSFVVWRENSNLLLNVGNGRESFARELFRVWHSVIWQKNVRLTRLCDLVYKCCAWRNVYKLENIRFFLKLLFEIEIL